MNERRRLIKNTGIIAIGNISTKLVSFFLLPLYTAVLSTAEYGAYDYIISIATFCVPFVSVLMDESIFRFLIDCITELDKKKIIFTVLGIPIMEGLHYSYTVYAIIYILLNVICGMLSALLRGIGRTDQFAFFNFLLGSLQIVLNVVFVAVLKLGLQGMLLASVLAQLIVATIFVLKIKLWKFINIKCVEISLAKEMIVYSFPLIPNKVSWTIINLSDRIILMNMIGSEATGLYAVSYILLLATYFANISGFYGGIFTAYKDTKIMGTTTVVAAIINLAVNIIMIRSLGIYAAAISTLVANFTVYIYRRIKVGKYIKLKENWKNRIVSLIICILIIILFYVQSKTSIIVGCIVSICYALIVNFNVIRFILIKSELKSRK